MKTQKSMQARSASLCFLTAFIWGIGFVAQSEGVTHVGPYTFTFFRSILATVFLAIVAMGFDKKEGISSFKKYKVKDHLVGGLCCGVFLTVATILQTIGLLYTSAGKTGFLTALYIVLVPVFSVFLGKKSHLNVWISVGIAVVGLFLLCVTENFNIVPTDLYVLSCAVLFTFHILIIDHFSNKTNGVWLSVIQFAVCTIISFFPMIILENPVLSSLYAAGFSIIYAGIFSSAGGYTLQIIGQKGLNPSFAALILSLESVVSVLAGWIILHQTLSTREIIGCALMLFAIILVQIDFSGIKKAL